MQMRTKRLLLYALLLTVGAFIFYTGTSYLDKTPKPPLMVGIPATWGTTVPALQYNYYGSIVLPNIFETLIDMDPAGNIIPLAASKWEMSDDYLTYTFTIDGSRKFSDGSSLRAVDFKNAWESGLRMNSKSANNSLHDIFSYVEGFDEFEKNNELTGIIIEDNEKLIIKLKSPYRAFLPYLSAGRFAAFKETEIEGKYIGTGPYVIEEETSERIVLKKNEYYVGDKIKNDNVIIEVVPIDKVKELGGKYDLLMVSQLYPRDDLNSFITKRSAHSVHRIFILNSKKGFLFNTKKYRQALQYYIYHKLKDNPHVKEEFHNRSLEVDFQSFLPLQPGRLSDDEVITFINQGKPYVEELLAVLKERKIQMEEGDLFEQMLFQTNAIPEIQQSIELINNDLKKNYFDIYYKKNHIDIMSFGFSVGTADPDGVRHILSENGAIFTPMMRHPKISSQTEKAMTLFDQNEVVTAYQDLNRTILEEVPYVHLGYIRHAISLNKDTMVSSNKMFSRNDYMLNTYEKK